jgi:predicted Fe-S protein YdhL (DUF1289 family)
MAKSKVRWPASSRPKQCMMHECKRPAMDGGAWCFDCLRLQLEAARKLLSTWRVLSKRQSAIVMAKINKTVERLVSEAVERRNEKLGADILSEISPGLIGKTSSDDE